MKILPAIDLKDGKCVRLSMGDYKQVKNYDFNPCELALKWADLGIKNLHIVDLDGARMESYLILRQYKDKKANSQSLHSNGRRNSFVR